MKKKIEKIKRKVQEKPRKKVVKKEEKTSCLGKVLTVVSIIVGVLFVIGSTATVANEFGQAKGFSDGFDVGSKEGCPWWLK